MIVIKFDLRNSWLFSFIGRLTIFLAAFSLLLLFLYISGNYQDFLASSQVFILNILKTMTLLGAIFSIYYLILLFFLAIVRKQVFIARFVFTIVSLTFTVILFGTLSFLFSWFRF